MEYESICLVPDDRFYHFVVFKKQNIILEKKIAMKSSVI